MRVIMLAFIAAITVTAADAATVKSRSGVAVRVAEGARAKLQCVIDYVEDHGVRVTAMRGFGAGTVRGSRHPYGNALDINQTHRDVTSPHVPRDVSNGAADKCGVISGARWGYADNGHWNLAGGRRSHRHARARRVHAAEAVGAAH